MKIKNLRLQNFKRFTDLSILGIPESSKLVLLIGANGSGKSSIFDAFSLLVRGKQRNFQRVANDYFVKSSSENFDISVTFSNGMHVKKTDPNKDTDLPLTAFYGRPSLRIVPKLNSNTAYNEAVIINNNDVPDHFIEADTKFNLDLLKYTQDINKALRDPVFAGIQSDTLQIFKDRIDPINSALNRIFNLEDSISLKIIQYEDSSPNKPPTLIFEKGTSKINYDLLSHGEKQIIIILLNFVVRTSYFKDTIYYIDEMDGHLNTSLQYSLLKEITENWIPENCQLWTASHALGFIEYAKYSDHASIIDLDNLDFDKEQTIMPKSKLDDEIFEIAISRQSLSRILGNKKIVLCENENYKFYSSMELKNYIFTDVHNASSLFLKIKRDSTLIGLRDRDFLTDYEVKSLMSKYPNYRILDYYCFENYIYHPENINELGLENFEIEKYKTEIKEIKNQEVNAIVQKIGSSRKSYEEFRPGGIKESSQIEVSNLTALLMSDNFEDFYKYLSFKDYCKILINKHKIDKDESIYRLSKTKWFIEKIDTILNS